MESWRIGATGGVEWLSVSASSQTIGGNADARRIRAAAGVEWLSVGTADQSHDDAEARRTGATVTWRRGGSERHQRRGAAGRKWQEFGGDLGLDASWMGKRLYNLIMGRVWRMADPRDHNSVTPAGTCDRVCFGRLDDGPPIHHPK
jgi:hypothetical protein